MSPNPIGRVSHKKRKFGHRGMRKERTPREDKDRDRGLALRAEERLAEIARPPLT